MLKRYLIASVAAVLVLGMAACGDDDDESASASKKNPDVIVKADFIQAANAACEQRSKEIQAKAQKIVAKYSGQPDSPKARKEVIEQAVAPGFEAEARDLRALEPPAGDEEQIDELITAIEEMVARTRKDLAEGRNYPYRKTENLAAAYGLPACGRP
jgi:hypothetical protein